MSTGMTDITGKDVLLREYEMVGERSKETHYYQVQTEIATHSSKGVLKSTDIYQQRLMVEPSGGADGEADKYTCARFSVQRGDQPEVTIPALNGYTYEINKKSLDMAGLDEQGQLYGIPEAKFEGLTDSTGAKLPFVEVAYQVYSLFFYYQGHVDYAEPSLHGKGVQHLKRIGDKVELETSFAELPLPGSLAGKGSVWKNGEVTLEFKGLGVIDEVPCAVLSFDLGVCTWVMPLTIMPLMRLKTNGVSFYRGDIYLDLESKWVRKLEMNLSEITVTSMWGIPVDKSILKTLLTIRDMSKEEFIQD
jgi:hypothetical protein